MFKLVIKMAAAALVAGVIALAITAAPAADGRKADQAPPQHAAKADRLQVPVKGTACSLHGWPNFEPACQFDVRESAGEARIVRIIALR